MHKIKINKQFEFETNIDSAQLYLNGEGTNLDISYIDSLNWHIINQQKSYNVEIVSINREQKSAQIRVNTNVYNLSAKDQFDLLLENLGLSSLNDIRVSEVKADRKSVV